MRTRPPAPGGASPHPALPAGGRRKRLKPGGAVEELQGRFDVGQGAFGGLAAGGDRLGGLVEVEQARWWACAARC
jgi:hypothetical protein